MSTNQQNLLPGTSYSTKSEALRLISLARDQSLFFIHVKINLADRYGDSRRSAKTFIRVDAEQMKTFIETAATTVDPNGVYDRFRIVVNNVDLGNGVVADSIWIG